VDGRDGEEEDDGRLDVMWVAKYTAHT